MNRAHPILNVNKILPAERFDSSGADSFRVSRYRLATSTYEERGSATSRLSQHEEALMMGKEHNHDNHHVPLHYTECEVAKAANEKQARLDKKFGRA